MTRRAAAGPVVVSQTSWADATRAVVVAATSVKTDKPRAFPGKVDTDLGFTRDRRSMSPESATADLGGFPKGNATASRRRKLALI
jgi:hypothetical protein